MLPRITQVRPLQDYILQVTFSDGVCAAIDFRPRIVGRGGVFRPLEDLDFFRQVRIEPDFGTLVWPNDVDFCPDVLYAEATRLACRASSV